MGDSLLAQGWLLPALLLVLTALPVVLNLRLWRRDRELARRLAEQRRGPPVLPVPEGNAPRISFLVAAWEEKPVIERCIRAIAGLPHPDVEIVLCAGGPDGTYAAAAACGVERVILLEQQPGEGKQHALQRCLEAATGDVIYLTDADCVITEETFRWCVTPILCGEEEAVTGSFYLPTLEQWRDLFVLSQASGRAYAAAHRPRNSSGLLGGNCVIRRAALERAGAFGTAVRTGTDYDLAKRLRRAGVRIRYRMQGSIQAEFPTHFRAYRRQQARWIRNVVLHGLRYRAYREVAACLRTSAVGLAMLALPLLGALLALAGGGVRQVGAGLLIVWIALFIYAILSRLRYLAFAALWLGLRYPLRYLPLLPGFLVADWFAWTVPLFEYASRSLRERW